MIISIEVPRQPEIEDLLAQGSAFAEALYPPESNFMLGVDELERPGVTVYVARDDAGRALGMAALVPLQGDFPAPTAELKRMFVHPSARGRGLGGSLLGRIEADAAAGGIRQLLIETGPRHDGALALYARHGYRETAQYGEYVGEEFSVCFAKLL